MAFDPRIYGKFPSTGGTGGMLTYISAHDTLAEVYNADYWNRDLSDVTNRPGRAGGNQSATNPAISQSECERGRKDMEDFVRTQRQGTAGVPIVIRGTSGMDMAEARIGTSGASAGRIVIQRGDFSLKVNA